MEDFYVFYHYITIACAPVHHRLTADDGRKFYVTVFGDRLRRWGPNPPRYNILVTENFYNETALESQKTHIWPAEAAELPMGEPQGYCRVLRFEVFEDFETVPTPLPRPIRGGYLEDFRIQTTDKEFKVSSAILTAKSEYFAALMRNECSESLAKLCRIEDVDSELFAQLLNFMYFGELDDYESILDLYILADRFEVNDLMEHCENIILSIMDTPNEETIMELAGAIGSKDFQRRLNKRRKWNAAKQPDQDNQI